MNRFYKLVSIAPQGGGYAIHLDGKPVRLPSGGGLVAPNAALADLVAQEWAAQGAEIDPETMPLTQILTTAANQDAQTRAAVREAVLAYLDTDLLCYRAAAPEEIARRQEDIWGRWCAWFAQESGAALAVTTGLAALKQPQAAHDFALARVQAMDPWHFNALQMATGLSGSLVMGLAFCAGAASPDDVYKAALVEEHYRAEIYNEALHGPDPHQEKTRNAMLRDLRALRQFLETLSGE